MFTVIVLALIFLIAIVALAFSVRIIKQYEKGLVIRLGKSDHTADAVMSSTPHCERFSMRQPILGVLRLQRLNCRRSIRHRISPTR